MKKFIQLLALVLIGFVWKTSVGQTPTLLNGGLRFNGEVKTTFLSGSTMYVGGSFTAINSATGPVVGVNTSLSPIVIAAAKNISGTVRSVVPDGSGGYFIGGSFNYFTGSTYFYNLIRVSSSGGVSPMSFISTNYTVNKLVVYGSKLFSLNANGVNRFSIPTNVQDAWAINALTGSANDGEVIGSYLYVGGRLANAGVYRPLYRINLGSMAFDFGWNPNIHSSSVSSNTNTAEIFAIQYLNTTNILYFGGRNVYYVQGQPRYNLAGISLSTNGVNAMPVQIAGGGNTVYSLALAGNNLYVGGDFNSFRNNTSGSFLAKSNLLVINLSYNQVNNAWSPNPNGVVRSLAYYNNSLLIAGGDFSIIQGKQSPYVAAYVSATSTPIYYTGSIARPNNRIYCIESLGTNLFFGGTFSEVEVYSRQRAAAFNITTGLPTSFNPIIDNGSVMAILQRGSQIFLGGDFTSAYATPRSYFVACNYLTGLSDPSIQINFNGPVRSMAQYLYSVYCGGDFTLVTTPLNSVQLARSYLACIGFTSGSAVINPTFNANLASATNVNVVNTLKVINGYLYAGGQFYSPRAKAVMMSLASGNYNPSFNLRVNNGTSNTSYVNDIVQVSSSQIAVAGIFANGFSQNAYNPSGTVNYGPPSSGGLVVVDYSTGNILSRNYSDGGEVSGLVKPFGNSVEYTTSTGALRSFNINAASVATVGTVTGTLKTLNYFNNSYWFGGSFTLSQFKNLGYINYTPAQGPTIAPTNFTVSNQTYNGMRVSWTNGNGARRIVLARQFSPVTTNPSNGVTYSANNFYGSGSDIAGAKVVYDGTGNFVDLAGLSPLTPYYFRVVEYNGVGINAMYGTNFLAGSGFTTDFPTPSISASNISFSNVSTNSMQVNFTRGNGNYCLVVGREGSPVSFVPNSDLTYPTSTSFYSMSLGGGNYGIYAGTANSVFVGGLNQGTVYYFTVFEYNQNGTLVRYRTLSVPSASQLTNSMALSPTVAASSMTFQNLSPSATRVQWVNGNGNKRLVLAAQGVLPTTASALTSNGQIYAANANFSSLSPPPSNIYVSWPGGYQLCKVVYNGTGNTVVVSGLIASTDYTYYVVEYNELTGFPNSAAYLGSPILIGSKRTDPNIVAPSISAQFPSSLENQNTIRLSWANGNGSNRLVVVRPGITPVSFVPQTNTAYSANSDYSSGTDLGSGQKVVYNGPGSSVDITGLLPYTTYQFAIYEYNTAFNNNTSTTDYAYRTTACTYAVKTAAPSWPRVAGGSDADASGGVAVDPSGNVYATGIIRGNVAFGLTTLTASGVDVFVSKYTSTGNQLWVKKFGSGGDEVATSILTDASGNFYLAGSYRGTCTFDSITVVSNPGAEDGYLAKFNSSGNIQWIRTFGSDSGDMVNTMNMDGQGNILIGGYHSGITNFRGASATLTSNGKSDFLVAKYTPNGDLVWARGGGSPGYDFVFGVGRDQNNGVYVCGEVQGVATFGSLSTLIYNGNSDAALVRYDASGTPSYVNRYGGTGDDRAMALDVDANGNVYMVGAFSATTPFGTTNLTSSGITDGFITKITGSTGVIQWAKGMGGVSQDIASGIDIGTSGEIMVTGSFGNVAYFDSEVITSMGNLDVFVATYSPTGLANTAVRFGGPLDDAARGIYAVSNTNTFISGYFNAQATFGGFDAYTKVQPVPPNSNWDMYVYNIGATYNSDPSADLVAWYRLNGNANDFSGNNYNGTIYTSAAPNTITPVADRNNTNNSAYSFSGTSRIESAIPFNNAYNNLNEVSVMAWVKVGSFSGNNYADRYIVSTDAATGMSLQLVLTRDQGLFGQVFDASGNPIGAAASLNYVYQQGTWAHIALTYEGGPTKVFLNGAVVGTVNFMNGTIDLSSRRYTIGASGENIGSNFNYYYTMNGSLDDVRIYRKALSAVQILDIMSAASSVSSPPMENGKNLSGSMATLLYPNPTNGLINFEMICEQESDISFRIVDLSGASSYEEDSHHYDAGVVRKTFDLSGLPAGFYTLQVIQGSQVTNHKLVLSK